MWRITLTDSKQVLFVINAKHPLCLITVESTTNNEIEQRAKWQRFKRCNRWTLSASVIIAVDLSPCYAPGPGTGHAAAANAWWSAVMWLWCHHPHHRELPSQSPQPPLTDDDDVPHQWSLQPPHKRRLHSPHNNKHHKWSVWPQHRRPPSGRQHISHPDTTLSSGNKWRRIPGKSSLVSNWKTSLKFGNSIWK